MKNLFLILLLLSFFKTTTAQDTLRSADFPSAGDTYVFSIGTSFTGIDATTTGPNFNWDYSQLGRSSQRLDTMFTTASTNPLLSFFFIDFPLNSNRANLAAHGLNFNLGFTGLTDVFNYFYNSSADYNQPGFGAVINAVPIPIAYTPHDVVYKFPLKYNDEDSVSFGYVVDLTSTIGIYYHVNRSRHNTVDGWGSLTTPYGTFDVLRVKSKIVEQDSVYIDTLHSGINTPAVTTYEYKWLGKGYGQPLLQINTSATNNITQILYQDSIHLTGITDLPSIGSEPVVFPNPTSGKIVIRYSLNKNELVKINLYSVDGKQAINLLNENQFTGENIKMLDLAAYHLVPGNYLIKVEAGNSTFTKSIQISK